MTLAWRRRLTALLIWTLVAAIGVVWLAHARLQQLQADFDTDARIAHRLLSQRMVQHDAVMATLVLLQPPGQEAKGPGTPSPPSSPSIDPTDPASPTPPAAAAVPSEHRHNTQALPRLPSVYPQILSVLQRPTGGVWPVSAHGQPVQQALAQAEAASRRSGHAQMAMVDLPAGRFYLVQAGMPASYALHIDLGATVPRSEWPMDPATSPVRVVLAQGGQIFTVQPGHTAAAPAPRTLLGLLGLGTFYAEKALASPSQPLHLVSSRSVALAELPWWRMLAWCLLTAALGAAGRALGRQRRARQRAEELLRLGQVARLNTLGELAAGMAHELNQPLTALLANTQAARRLLADDPIDLATAQSAMERAVEQARRASSVVARLRRLVERPELTGQVQPLACPAAVQDVVNLLEPDLAQRGVALHAKFPTDLPQVLADPVALQQIIYNLLTNALQALDHVPPAARTLTLRLTQPQAQQVRLSVRDSGSGIATEARAHLFEPFFTTRSGGLGLGLTLCESLAQAMGAQLVLAPADGQAGAEFWLTLPVASDAPVTPIDHDTHPAGDPVSPEPSTAIHQPTPSPPPRVDTPPP